ncbi:MAG TPA: hypothetical protein VFN48_05305 [Solirubrobacteraceae bacterium]|nr:hypothetical protein [Solirubrobacteraceae bacterium]
MRESKVLNRFRFVPAGLLAAVMTLSTAGTAHASLLTQDAQNCGTPQDVQAFLPWGDINEYFLAPDGNFAGSAASWTLSGGASAVAGGDGYSLAGAAPSTQSLSLPDGSSATTPSFCVGFNAPTIRFFAENSGSTSSTLAVSATATTSFGTTVTLSLGQISATSTWNPSAPLAILFNVLEAAPGSETPVTLTFTPQGTGGNWQIDDLYVDPWMRGG